MAVTFGFYDSLSGDRLYNAQQVSSIFDGIITDGVFQSMGAALAVTPNSGMNINVGAGRAWFNHTWTFNSTTLILAVEASEIALNRIDTVILEVNANVATRANSIKIIKGTPASTPVHPTLTNAGDLHQYPLADIYVAAGVISINAGNITNRIGTTDCPFITGILTTINMAWLFANWGYQFQTWFDNLVDQLTGEQVTNLQNQINQINSRQCKNLLIDGEMRIAQSGSTGETGVTTAGYRKAPDMWYFNVGNLGTWTVSQGYDPNLMVYGLSKYFSALVTTADAAPAASDLCVIQQRLDGRNLQMIRKGSSAAKKLTLSFLVKSPKTGTHIAELVDNNNTRHVCAAYTINTANTWELKTIVFPADTSGVLTNDSSLSFLVNFWLAAGSNYTSGTLDTTWATTVSANRAVGQVNVGDTINNEFGVTLIQLELGDIATPFEQMSFQERLDTVLSYYQKSFSYGVVPAQGAGYLGAFDFIAGKAGALSDWGWIVFPRAMRGAPTMTFYNPTNANGQVYDRIAAADCSATVNLDTGDKSVGIQCTGNAATAVGNLLSVHWVADARL